MIDDRSIQRFLQSKGFYSGAIDGAFGPASHQAARAFLTSLRSASTSYGPAWPDARVRVGVEQAMFESIGQDLGVIDGVAGPRTQIARERWQDHVTFVAPSADPSAGVHKATEWPRQSECIAFYGQPGHTANVRLVSPYPLYLDWALTQRVDSFLIHENCHDAALRAMGAILAHYGPEQIHALGLDQFGGALNVRRMRNGSAWSMHAFGCAIDWDADRNQLRENHRTARFARPEYAAFLDAWEAEGAISLGRARDFDWMHVQFARL